MTYLNPNTVKSYIRSLYQKIGVTSRTQAVLWGIVHGFTPCWVERLHDLSDGEERSLAAVESTWTEKGRLVYTP